MSDKKIEAGLVSIVLFALLLGLQWAVVVAQAHREVSATNQQLMTLAKTPLDEARMAFERLQSVRGKTCSRELLTEMRKSMFLNSQVHDVYFFPENDLTAVCSANRGLFKKPVTLVEPDYLPPEIPGQAIWYAYPLDLFDGEEKSYVLKIDRFAFFLVHPEVFSTFATELDWQIYAIDLEGNFFRTAYGSTGVREYFETIQGNWFLSRFGHKACSFGIRNFCVVAVMPTVVFFDRYAFGLVIGTFLSLLLSIGAFSWTAGVLAYRASPKGRILKSVRNGGHGLHCNYQPIVDLASGRVIGCEVLARYKDGYGPLFPDQFVGLIEKHNLTWEFTRIIMSKALYDLRDILHQSSDFKVSINFYPSDLAAQHIDRFRSNPTLTKARQNELNINCEILETGLEEYDVIKQTLGYLRNQGFTIAIDDFGTGYSNLAELMAIKAEFLKIDKSFVQGLGEDEQAIRTSLVPHIVEIAKVLELQIIAEGIETEAQMKVLNELNVGFGQGYLFSKPLPIDEFSRYLSENV